MRAKFTSTGAEGSVLSSVERTGLGDLDGMWHQVRFNDTLETIWVHADGLEIPEDEEAESSTEAESEHIDMTSLGE